MSVPNPPNFPEFITFSEDYVPPPPPPGLCTGRASQARRGVMPSDSGEGNLSSAGIFARRICATRYDLWIFVSG